VNHTDMIHTKSKQLSLLIQYCPESVFNTYEKHLKLVVSVVYLKGLIS